jgi:hypothetical protein
MYTYTPRATYIIKLPKTLETNTHIPGRKKNESSTSD